MTKKRNFLQVSKLKFMNLIHLYANNNNRNMKSDEFIFSNKVFVFEAIYTICHVYNEDD